MKMSHNNRVSENNTPMIVVSNRLPFVLKQDAATGKLIRHQSAGGLVTAVAPVVIECKGLWVGWPGIHTMDPTEPVPESDPSDKAPTAGLLSNQVVCVHVEEKKFDDYYNGCCNGTFWPLFHSMPDRAIFKADNWEAYKEVNEAFAHCTLEALRTCVRNWENSGGRASIPLVWIHDYHLMIAANTIRQIAEEENLPFKLGFFLHIPYPAWDIMRLFPWDDEVLQGILGNDLVAFHIEDYCLNFIDCCQRRLGCRVDRTRMLVEHGGRTIHVKALPIGIPYDHFVSLAESAPKFIREENEKLILGVDRLDYTKGLVNRVKSFERLLEKHPEYIEKVTMLQIAVPSRTDVQEYKALKEEMDQVIGRINGRFTRPNWSPIRYIYGCISQEQLAAFYRDSSVALVTPLRDGMNLVAKEFVACQIRDPGVLILSPFAGAGGMMHEALLVNPYEIDDVADAIHRALQMPLDERKMRMTQLRYREKQMDVNFWLQSFLTAVSFVAIDEENALSSNMMPMTVDDFDQYLFSYIDDFCKLSVILDYDGTLSFIAPHPDLAIMPPETRRVLERLSNMPDVNICIISGRSLENLRKMVNIEGITYAGSHGLEILHCDGTKFVHPIPHEYEEKLRDLLKALQDEVCHDGAWVENKGVLLTFHYRETPLHKRDKILRRATEIFKKAGFEPHRSHMAIEAKPPVRWDRGRASIYILRTTYGVDWSERVRIIYAGDDASDEEAMEVLKGISCTFRVTSSLAIRSAANFRLANPDSVLTMLKWVEKQMNLRVPRSPRNSPPRLPGIERIHSQISFEEEESDSDNITYTKRKRCNSKGKQICSSPTSLQGIVHTVGRGSDESINKAV